ncbi:MAG TPA: hypothetical protein VL295_02110 [Gemmatimonadales bacterium]|nr:hypothetical protein [Gemmatimonadales bacterium]
MRRTAPAGLLVLFLASCGPGWHRTDVVPGTALEARDQFLIHHGTTTDRWHAVKVSEDSVIGIPWLQPIECDSCRVALPRASVDSIRAGHPVGGFWKGYALVAWGPIVAFALACTITGEFCWPSD